MKADLNRLQARSRIEAFLAAYPDTELRHYYEVEGFLFAINSSPELVMPSEWLDLIYGEEGPVWRSEQEAADTMQALLSLYNAINNDIREDQAQRACTAMLADDPLDNLAEKSTIRLWARGFEHGHGWLADLWQAYLDEFRDTDGGESMFLDWGMSVMSLVAFAGRETFDGVAKVMIEEEDAKDEAEVAFKMADIFPFGLETYSHIGRIIHEASFAMESGDEKNGPPNVLSTPGRNDPCPCGSGKKYKKCCGMAE